MTFPNKPQTAENTQTKAPTKEYLFQCMNPECFENNNVGYVFSSILPICPKCNARPPYVGTAVILHFLYKDNKGSMLGYMGHKYTIACGKKFTCTPYEGMTNSLEAANCPSCKNSEIYKAAWSPNPNDPLSYFRDPNLTQEQILELLKGQNNGGTP